MKARTKQQIEEASEYYAHNYFNMHETNSYKELKKGFEAGVEWAIKQNNFIADVEIIYCDCNKPTLGLNSLNNRTCECGKWFKKL
jgi:hypothetical protein